MLKSSSGRAFDRRITVGPERQRSRSEATGSIRSHDWRFIAGAGAIVVGALILRLYGISAQEIWIDEAFSWYVATTRGLRHILLIENSPPLYYLLLRGWVALAGASATVLRLPSALAGTLFVATVLLTGREIFDARMALWSGAAAALAPIHIYYSQEARAYALLVLLLLLNHVLVWRALQTNTWPRWALVSASTLLALYTHYLAVLGLLPSALLLLLWPDRARWRRYCTAMLASGLGFSPWVVWSFGLTPRSDAAFDWIRQVWEITPPPLAIPRSLEVFGLGSQAGLPMIFLKQFTRMEFPAFLRILGLVVLVLLALWVAVPWGDRDVGIPGLGKRKTWLGLALVIPLGLLWLISFSYRPLYAPGRYDLVAFPAYTLILGLALAKAQRVRSAGPVVAVLFAMLLLLPIGTKLFRYYHAPPDGDAEATAKVLHAGVADGDVVVFTGLRGTRVLYYLSRLGYEWDSRECRDARAARRFGCRMYPRETEQMPGVLDARRVLASPDAVRSDVQDYLRVLPPQGGAVWVVLQSGGYSQGRVFLPNVDALLFRELHRLGLTSLPVQGASGIFWFGRS